MKHQKHLIGLQLALRVALAGVAAYALADLLRFKHPIYAFIAAVIVTDLSSDLSRRLGWTRLAATLVGALIGAALSQALGPGAFSLGVGVLAAMLACQVLNLSEGAKVAGYICGLILIDHRGEPWSYAVFRLLETALGVIVAWGISAVPRLIAPDKGEGEKL